MQEKGGDAQKWVKLHNGKKKICIMGKDSFPKAFAETVSLLTNYIIPFKCFVKLLFF